MDQFLWESGVDPNERVTVISDDAGEFDKAVQQSPDASGLWCAASQGAADQQQHRGVGDEPSGQPSHGEEAANALD